MGADQVREVRLQVVDLLLGLPGLTKADRADLELAALVLSYVEARARARDARARSAGPGPREPDFRERQLPRGDR